MPLRIGYVADMNSLKHRTIWLDKREDEENNKLEVRSEKTVALAPAPPSSVQTCTIEVTSPSEDDYGRPAKKRRTVRKCETGEQPGFVNVAGSVGKNLPIFFVVPVIISQVGLIA